MKKIFLSLVFVCIAGAVFATAPMGIKIDVTGNTVSILVDHKVSNPEKHYIKTITVKVNDKLMVTQEFTSQEDNEVQKAFYNIPGLVKGDKLEVYAECIKGGDLTEKYTVKK